MTPPPPPPDHQILVVAVTPGNTPFPDYFRDKWNITSVDALQARIAVDCARAASGGYPLTMHQIDLSEVERGLSVLETMLREGRWDGIMFGAGFRLVPEDPSAFETAVNLCRRLAPNVPLMFNHGPDTHCTALERMFGAKFD